MQMKELSISKLQPVPAKCMIMDVGSGAITIIQIWKGCGDESYSDTAHP